MEQHLAQAQELYSEYSKLASDQLQQLHSHPLCLEFQAQCEQLGNRIIWWALGDDTGKTSTPPPSPTENFPFASFHCAAETLIAYLLFVVVVGLWQLLPFSRKWELYGFRFFYNLVQMMLSSYMCVEAVMLAYRNGYSWVPCNPFNAEQPNIANLLWLFYVSKILDFCDTIFIVLGKKWTQLTFLHVYHHATIFSIYWLNLRVGYDGDIFLTVVLNGFVHAVMYTYYFLSMHTKDIPWKKYLTQLQMFQFCIMVSQGAYMLRTECPTFPHRVTTTYVIYINTLLVLFAHFYFTSIKKGGKKDSSSTSKTATVTSKTAAVTSKTVTSKSAQKSGK